MKEYNKGNNKKLAKMKEYFNKKESLNKHNNYFDNYDLSSPMLKDKTNKKSKAVKLLSKIALYGLIGSLSLFSLDAVVQEVVNKAKSEEIKEALDYYGGIDNYLGKTGLLNSYTKFETYDTKNIRVGLDETIDESTAEQMKYSFDYLNSIFEIINPNYHFNLIRADEKNCDIFIHMHDWEKEPNFLGFSRAPIAVEYGEHVKNSFTHHTNAYAKIAINKIYSNDKSNLRYTILHEIMHVLFDNHDLSSDETEKYNHDTVPFSVLSYNHSITMTYPELYLSEDKMDDLDYYKDEFVIYPPFDLAAYAARYGDFKNEENKQACTQLIVDTYKTCCEVFGTYRKYFLDDTELNKEGYPVRFEQFINQNNNSATKNNIFNYKKGSVVKADEFEL